MAPSQEVRLLYGRDGLTVRLPAGADVLEGRTPPPLPDVPGAIELALARPIGAEPLEALVRSRRPRTVAVTVSDITRPVPNRDFLPPMLAALNRAGVADRQIVIIIGTGMHRPSRPEERERIVGREVLARVEVIDHQADRPETLVKVSDEPPVSVCRRFAAADFRIVTGYIEPHFMAGFSGGRKGVCPALVDLATIQRFHGYATLADPRADNGVLEGNPCHEIALGVARAVGVDFLFNVAITRDRRMAGIYCGELEQAHQAGCREVAQWCSAQIDGPYDLVVTNGGGRPLDATFYQTVKGMCTALPALRGGDDPSTLIVASECSEALGSPAYTELMLAYGRDWRRFLADIAASGHTRLDQWELQMQCRVLERIGMERLMLASDGIGPDVLRRIAVTPLDGAAPAASRVQAAINDYLARRPAARVAVIPDGPYTMLRRTRT